MTDNDEESSSSCLSSRYRVVTAVKLKQHNHTVTVLFQLLNVLKGGQATVTHIHIDGQAYVLHI